MGKLRRVSVGVVLVAGVGLSTGSAASAARVVASLLKPWPTTVGHGTQPDPDVSGFAGRRAVAAWNADVSQSKRIFRYEIRTRTLGADGTWSHAVNLSGAKLAGIDPVVAATANGGAVVAWCTSPGYPAGNDSNADGLVVASRASAGARWTTKLIRSPCSDVAVAPTSSGTVVVVWPTTTTAGAEQIRMLSGRPGSVAAARSTIVYSGPKRDWLLYPQVVAGSDGTTAVSWTNVTGGSDANGFVGNLAVAVKRPGAGWATYPAVVRHIPAGVGGFSVSQQLPTLAVSDTGSVLFTWYARSNSASAGYARFTNGLMSIGVVPGSRGGSSDVVSDGSHTATVVTVDASGIQAEEIDTDTGAWGPLQRIAGAQIARDGYLESVTAGTDGSVAVGFGDPKQGLIITRAGLSDPWSLAAAVNFGTVGSYLALTNVTPQSMLASWVQGATSTSRFVAQRIGL